MKYLLLLSITLCTAWLAVQAAIAQQARGGLGNEIEPAAFKVVVNSANESNVLSRSQISNYLLKKKSRWENGSQVDPVDLVSRSKIRAAMSQLIHERSVASIKNYWQRQIFSGHNTPPPELDSDQAVLDFVGSNPGGIGYVAAGTPTPDEVKELKIVE